MRAHLLRVEAERPELDHAIVRGLYERFMDCRDRQPDLREFRDYVDEIASSVDWLDLWHEFSPHEPTVEEHEAMCGPVEPAPRRPRGRPRGTGLLTEANVRDTYRALRLERPTQAVTQEALAERLDVTVRSLQRFLKRHDMGWPLAE
jgi:hypothetical protein